MAGGGTFAGRVVVVTGASKGIGRALASGFGREGASVVVSSRDQGRCDAVVAELAAEDVDGLAVAAHMGRGGDIDALVDATLTRFGRIDVVVNNAATNPAVAPLLDTGDALVEKLFSVNVIGPLHLARRAAVHMAERGTGSILNVASRSAFAPEPEMGPYAASKAALVTLSKAMAMEWAPLGVRVNTLAPGPFATTMVHDLFEEDDFRSAMLASTAQGRIADPDEIVGAALFLCGPTAGFVTGAVLRVDGGMLP